MLCVRLELAVCELILTTGTLPLASEGLVFVQVAAATDTYARSLHCAVAMSFSRTCGGVA